MPVGATWKMKTETHTFTVWKTVLRLVVLKQAISWADRISDLLLLAFLFCLFVLILKFCYVVSIWCFKTQLQFIDAKCDTVTKANRDGWVGLT